MDETGLTQLGDGEAFVLSPQRLKLFSRMQMNNRTTFNSSATPRPGETAVVPKRLAPIDIKLLEMRMAETIEHTAANDPDQLKRRVRELETQLAAAKRVSAAPAVASKPVEVLVVPETLRVGIAELVDQTTGLQERVARMADQLQRLQKEAQSQRVSHDLTATMSSRPLPARTGREQSGHAAPVPSAPGIPTILKSIRVVGGTMPSGLARVLSALIAYPAGLSREQLTVLTGYKRTTRDLYLQQLQALQYTARNGDLLVATTAGRAALPDSQPLPRGKALRDHWLAKLPAGERRVLECLISVWPQSVSREELSDMTEYKRTTRDLYIQRLKARQLVQTVTAGLCASPTLFDGEGG